PTNWLIAMLYPPSFLSWRLRSCSHNWNTRVGDNSISAIEAFKSDAGILHICPQTRVERSIAYADGITVKRELETQVVAYLVCFRRWQRQRNCKNVWLNRCEGKIIDF